MTEAQKPPFIAAATDLSRLLHPCGIAVVGASADPTRIGGQPIHNLLSFGYKGGIFPVNPKRTEIQGLPCFPEIKAIPGPCDVAIIAVAAAQVPGVLDDCAGIGIPFAVVLSAGFREIGRAGTVVQAELDSVIDKKKIRVMGPNCVGFFNLGANIRCGFGPGMRNPDLKAGPIAMVTQSGGFGMSVIASAARAGIGFNYVAATGNEADINTLDFLSYFLERPEVKILAAYIEGVQDGRRLLEIGARALAIGKPILVWKAGNTRHGRIAAETHTANLTGSYELYKAAFRQSGFIEVQDVDDLIDIARTFQCKSNHAGRNIGVITGSGGAGVVVADACDEVGLDLPSFSPETVSKIETWLPNFASPTNPLDVTAQLVNDFSLLNKSIKTILDDPKIDQLIVRCGTIEGELAEEWVRDLHSTTIQSPKPIHLIWGGSPDRSRAAITKLDEYGIPWYLTPRRSVKGAAALSDFTLRRSLSQKLAKGKAVRSSPKVHLDLPSDRKRLGEHASKCCLEQYGIAGTREFVLPPDMLELLKELPFSFPVAVKIESPDLPHKTEAGVVRLNIQSMADLKSVATHMLTKLEIDHSNPKIDGILIQEMVSGIETIAGATVDPHFGPIVVFGLGGIFTELLNDVTYRFAPFGVDIANEMIDETKAKLILRGYRGQPASDVAALASTLSSLSYLISDHADLIAEIDINPLFVRPAGQGVVAADALIVLQEGHRSNKTKSFLAVELDTKTLKERIS